MLESTLDQLETAAMKIATARHSRPMKTQRSNRRGSRMALSAGSDDRGVSRTEGGGVANCEDSRGSSARKSLHFAIPETIPRRSGYSGRVDRGTWIVGARRPDWQESGGIVDDATYLNVTPRMAIPRSELQYRASRSGGPGGQHVNTSSTRIELLWDLNGSRAVTEEERERLRIKLAARLDSDGMVRVVASDRRSQQQNRQAADERLARL